ncbi:MAG TPA: peptide chain release factor N(5)-glutamine methyltransferase [Pseudolabrys sp.]|nr:peptide chain release factor N(5)-glutamine methyltransferase [Pseudolabrys sp.]
MRIVAGLKADASVAETVRLVSQAFRAAHIEAPEADARLLIGHALHLSRAQLTAQAYRLLEAREVNMISALAARRLRHEPVARILGRKEFWSLELQVTPAVLVPRPETETLIESALDAVTARGLRLEKLRVLDIGTGSGALLLAALKELPNAIGTGTDVNADALEVARANAARLQLAARSTFVACDIAIGVAGPFDLILSNPPYIASGDIASLMPEVRDYDPRPALDGGSDGLDFYRRIAADALPLMAPGGRLIVELGVGQEAAVSALFTKAGLAVDRARKDLAGIPRSLAAAAP